MPPPSPGYSRVVLILRPGTPSAEGPLHGRVYDRGQVLGEVSDLGEPSEDLLWGGVYGLALLVLVLGHGPRSFRSRFNAGGMLPLGPEPRCDLAYQGVFLARC